MLQETSLIASGVTMNAIRALKREFALALNL